MALYLTERLVIRRFSERDAAAFLDYMSDPRVNCFLEEKLSGMQEAIADVRKKSKDRSQFAVCRKEDDMLIGHLFAMKEGDTYNVGWHFNTKIEGRGYATEATKGLFNYLFHRKNARRIYCYVEDYNTRSQQLCKRLGMREEGLFLEYISFTHNDDGSPRYENTLQFALLKKEWV
ncbi:MULTISPECIES: GNAT family N-acetyltransferase [unclassified Chryseobacterium]|uniref:GNAT family N-acetyltransferase n=1 Tax=unclassified Chryseobacterium TaxID=2593645 RepID=UPI001159AEFD|nr:GNAT family protein [Chryseobacterium sp. ON_d1]GEJ45931.1 N-acetyltransferase GCN5 [Chryseobacterium sp. ON_d1]